MFRVAVFTSGKAAGFVRFDGAKHRMRLEGVLSSDSVDAIRKDVEAGRIRGYVGPYDWYRQATLICPLDSTTLCPCDKEVCGALSGAVKTAVKTSAVATFQSPGSSHSSRSDGTTLNRRAEEPDLVPPTNHGSVEP